MGDTTRRDVKLGVDIQTTGEDRLRAIGDELRSLQH